MNALPNHLLSLLPEEFASAVAPLLSAAGILALLEELGGQDLLVPTRQDARGAIAERLRDLLSPEDFAGLIRGCAGSRLTIPIGRRLLNHLRDQEILRLRRSGMYIGDIARKIGVHERTVYTSLARSGAEGPTEHQA